MKLEAKKRISTHKKNTAATGGGGSQSQLSADEHVAGIIGETSLSGIIPDGDSDMPSLQRFLPLQNKLNLCFKLL